MAAGSIHSSWDAIIQGTEYLPVLPFNLKLMAIFTDKDNAPLGYSIYTSRLEARASIAPEAVRNMASGVVIIAFRKEPHLGDIEIDWVKKLREALHDYGVRFLDYIKVGDGEYFSFADDEITSLNAMV